MKILLTSLCVLIVLYLPGCTQSSSSEVQGGKVSVNHEEKTQAPTVATENHDVTKPDGTKDKYVRTEQNGPVTQTKTVGEAAGASGLAKGDKVDQKVDGTPPALNLPGVGGGSGGGFSAHTSAFTAGGWNWLLIAGIVIVLSGLAYAYYSKTPAGLVLTGPSGVRTGLEVAALGGVMIVASLNEQLKWLLIAGIVVFSLLRLYKARAHDQALATVTTKLNTAMDALGKTWAGIKTHASAEVAKAIDNSTSDAHTTVIAEAKAQNGV